MRSSTAPPILALVARIAQTLSIISPAHLTALQTLALTEVSVTTLPVLAIALAPASTALHAPSVISFLSSSSSILPLSCNISFCSQLLTTASMERTTAPPLGLVSTPDLAPFFVPAMPITLEMG